MAGSETRLLRCPLCCKEYVVRCEKDCEAHVAACAAFHDAWGPGADRAGLISGFTEATSGRMHEVTEATAAAGLEITAFEACCDTLAETLVPLTCAAISESTGEHGTLHSEGLCSSLT